ncbi:uncharacterized protein [Panulirus ornatus]|uniref:uncharacterized protein isoform X2 n=1 Tax=Panulirus ornatus TaxID=150431 RepID=UPI003A89B0C5
MCELRGLKAAGVTFAVLAVLVSLGTEGFYAWKTYELENECETNNFNNSDVCDYDELQVRTYIGLTEGILGTIVSLCLIIGFASPYLPLIWIWVAWGLGISSYNAYCIYDYYEKIETNNDGIFPWEDFIDQDYGYFFVVALASVCSHGLILLFTIPLGAALTHMIGPDSATEGSYELLER